MRSLSIRAKMILTSGLLIAFLVGIFGYVTHIRVTEDLSNERTRITGQRMTEMGVTGQLLADTVAEGVLPLLADNQLPNLSRILNGLVEETDSESIEIVGTAIMDDRGLLLEQAPEDYSPDWFDLAQVNISGEAVQFERIDPRFGMIPFAVVSPVDHNLGFALIEFGTGPLERELSQIENNTANRRKMNLKNTLVLGTLSIVLGILIAIIQGIRITGPILRLTGVAEHISEGDLSVRAPTPRGQDEITTLSSSFNKMADRIQDLLVEEAEKVSLKKEMEVARVVQETLLPPTGIIERPPLQIYGYLSSASVCGGDFWNLMDLEDGRTLLAIGDVTGHGVPSAMITAAAKSAMDTVRNIKGNHFTLSYLLEQMNLSLFSSARRKFAMSFCALLFEPMTGELFFANAGHHFPLLLRPEGDNCNVTALISRGNRLGDLQSSRYRHHTTILEPNDVVVLFTDGISEYRNRDGEEFSERRFRRTLVRVSNRPPEEIARAVLEDLSAFVGDAPQIDDMTLIVIKVNPKGDLNQPEHTG